MEVQEIMVHLVVMLMVHQVVQEGEQVIILVLEVLVQQIKDTQEELIIVHNMVHLVVVPLQLEIQEEHLLMEPMVIILKV